MNTKMLLVVAIIMSSCGAGTDAEVKLIGGQVASIPQIVELGPVGCSAAVIGPRTILTAAHCYASKKTTTFKYQGKKYSAVTYRNPNFNNWAATNDHTLGYTSEKMPPPYASLDFSQVQVGQTVQLNGYGCIKSGGGGSDHQLRIGLSRVQSVTSLEFITRTGAALCFGDSGGPVTVYGKGLKVIGVNSKGNIQAGGNSWLARVDIPSFRNFLSSYVSGLSASVCGYNSNSNCL